MNNTAKKQKIRNKKLAKGYAIFRSGYWLICPSYLLALANCDYQFSDIVKVTIYQEIM